MGRAGDDGLSRVDLEALLAFLRELESEVDEGSFAERVSLGLLSLIPCDGGGFNDVDIGASAVQWFADPSDLADGAGRRKDAFEAFMLQHPAIAAFSQRGDGRARKLSDFGSRRRFQRTEIYNEFYGPLELEHHLVCHWTIGEARYGAMSLFRTRSDFSERDRAMLGLARPYLALAQRTAMAQARAEQVLTMFQEALTSNGQALVVIAGLDRVGITAGRAHELIADYFDPGQPGRLPDELVRWAVAQRGRLNAQGRPPLLPSVLVKDGTHGRLFVQYLPRTPDRSGALLLTEEPRAPGSCALLTAREREVLERVAAGDSNREIADSLCVTVSTVKKHLEHIYRKLDVTSRTAAVAKRAA